VKPVAPIQRESPSSWLQSGPRPFSESGQPVNELDLRTDRRPAFPTAALSNDNEDSNHHLPHIVMRD
jgi:hypothetical protein